MFFKLNRMTMKAGKIIDFCLALLLLFSCATDNSDSRKIAAGMKSLSGESPFPLDRGFTKYITGYTSGIISSKSVIEIRFTPEFAARAAGKIPPGLFTFEPSLRGKTEWIDETTLTFTPSKLPEPGKDYNGTLNLGMLADVEERLREFPLRFRTLTKDFTVTPGALECISEGGDVYALHGELTTSDYIPATETESYLKARLGRKQLNITWDHSSDPVHAFTVEGIERTDREQKLELEWNGSTGGISRKGSIPLPIPGKKEFTVIDVMVIPGGNHRLDVVFSDPVDQSQDFEGLIWFGPDIPITTSVRSNIVSIFPASRPQGPAGLNIEAAVRNTSGSNLNKPFSKEFDFSQVPPSLSFAGNGVILPSSENLIFPFKAANLKAVYLRIIRIFENNLPDLLRENDIDGGYSLKRFGIPVYSGRIDLVNTPGDQTGTWNLHTIDLADYIKVEPGVLYRVELSMRRSYSLYPCAGGNDESSYESLLNESESLSKQLWADPENYYDDVDEYLYYSQGFDWNDRDDPCKDAYYSPDKKIARNIFASNIGIIAKQGTDNILHMIVSDLVSAMPLNEVTIDVYDYQNQMIATGLTDRNGSANISCEGTPFLVIAGKDKDRNYLKVNDGSALSLSSFDVAGTRPLNGINAFIYGERDVWRPGDSIYLSLFIRDMNNRLPEGHPVRFELINPSEQKVDVQVHQLQNRRLTVIRTATDPAAVTGNYTARFSVGGAVFEKKIRIETIKPNRLKIELGFPDKILGGSKGSSTVRIKARWLSGAMAGDLSATVEYLLKHTGTVFERYKQYNFDDPTYTFYSETVRTFESRLSQNGEASFTFDPGVVQNAPGMLNAIFTARVMEKGGDESIIQSEFTYAPFPVFVGINIASLTGKDRMLHTDEDNKVDVVTVDESGKPVNSKVEFTVYKINYRWWWESDRENLAWYISNNVYKPVITKTINTTNGLGSFSFRINRNDWGRYLIRASVPGGHSTGKIVLMEWPWEYGMKGGSEGATLLSVATDREKYYPGDEIRLSFPSPANARAIITLENSTGILEEIRTITSGTSSEIRFRARPEMAPNVYAFVTIIQPHSQSVNDMPVRLYGVVPVMVEDRNTRLAPIIKMPGELRSMKEFTIAVSEETGKAMDYTLAVVDEGLLDITGYKTPDPWGWFYSREALGVRTWDLYDYVLGAYGGTLERIFAVGGDETLIDQTANKARRFGPVVRFLGPFTLQQGKTASHRITLPQYTGSVKVMVVAGNDRAFGSASASAMVRDPLMVLATAPRVLSPGEKVMLPVTLFVQKQNITNVTIKAEGNNLVRFESNSISLPHTTLGERDTAFYFSTSDVPGIARIKITASGGGETASYELETDIRSPNPPESRSTLHIVKPGEKWETSFTPFGTKGSSTATLEASSLPSIDLKRHISYLMEYPHGCTEQIISSAFPQIWLRQIAPGNGDVIKEAPENIKEAINKIMQRQMNSGGITLWPEATQPDNWVTSYAGHFFSEAERNGFTVPSSMKTKWLAYQKNTALAWRYDPAFKGSANDQAYRLFTMALAGQPDRGAMNRLRESKDIPQLSRWLLAAAYALSGRPEAASELIDIRMQTEPEYRDLYYGSELRDKGVILYTLALLKKEEEALPLLNSLSESLNSNAMYSTQSLSWALIAFMKYSSMMPENDSAKMTFSLNLNGNTAEKSLTTGLIWSENLKIKDDRNILSVINNSDKPLYFNLVNRGVPLMSDMTREEKGIAMKVSYTDLNLKPVDQKTLAQGSDFMMIVSVTNTGFSEKKNLALVQMLPSGWEIRNTRLFAADYGIRESSSDYRDIRDDRVNTYFGLARGETKTFVLILNAAYQGEFYHPTVWCTAMYDTDSYSRLPGYRVRVARPRN